MSTSPQWLQKFSNRDLSERSIVMMIIVVVDSVQNWRFR